LRGVLDLDRREVMVGVGEGEVWTEMWWGVWLGRAVGCGRQVERGEVGARPWVREGVKGTKGIEMRSMRDEMDER
jgi:hypothetical protein